MKSIDLVPTPIRMRSDITIARRAAMTQEAHNGEHDHSAVRVAVWYDYI